MAPNTETGSASSAHLVVLEGTLSSNPVERKLPSGTTLVILEVSSRAADGQRLTSPVVSEDLAVANYRKGDLVLVLGVVRRRFFRAGGITASRTEVVADAVVSAVDRRARKRLGTRALGLLQVALGPEARER